MVDLGIVERDERSAAFFDAAAEGRLVVRRCDGCSAFYPPELPACPACRSLASTWVDVAGSGELIAWVVVHRRADTGPLRTVVATVELDEGPWLTLPLDADPDVVRAAGERMSVGFLAPGEAGRETVPVWRPGVPA
jgi:hypothetical protein